MNKFTYRGWKLDYNSKYGYTATGPGGDMLTAHSRVEIERKIDSFVNKNEPAWA